MNKMTTALILGDLQNDFLHPDGAYGRARQSDRSIAALPVRLAPLVHLARERHILVVATLFTLVPGRGGEPIISPHLKSLRPFLKKGDFSPGSWGQQVIEPLAPADINVEKIASFARARVASGWEMLAKYLTSPRRMPGDSGARTCIRAAIRVSVTFSCWQRSVADKFLSC